MYIGDWLQRRAQLTPEKIALIDMLNNQRPITFCEWNDAATQTAAFLSTLGVRKGDRVAILALNCVEYLDIWFACGKLGSILQALNYRLTSGELHSLIVDTTPTVLIYGPEQVEQVQAIRAQGVNIQHYIALDTTTRSGKDDRTFEERKDHINTVLPTVELRYDDPWVICYTGGTTGLPKGAILTHGNVTWNSINTVMSWGITPDDVAILNSPLFHTGGLNVFTAPLVHIGGVSIICRSFDANQVFDLVESGAVTLYFGVPTMFITMQQHPRWAETDFARLKLIISGGAPCPMPVFERFWERGVDFKTGYGLTEAGPNTFWLPPADVQRKPGAVGVPLFHIDVKVIDEQGNRCPPDQIGELLIRGPHVCAGYWNCPEESAQAIVGGWLHTGDLAYCDAEGYYFVVGRLKDMIISGGENIYPAEVESVLAAHPAVAEAALIGIPDARWGEVGRAIVIRKSDSTLNEEALIAFGRERMAAYKVPKSVIFVETLPKNAAGKIDKQLLRQHHGTQKGA